MLDRLNRAGRTIVTITLHGGEASEVAAKFSSLPKQDQDDLLAFLGTLRAPQVAGFIVREESPIASNWRSEGTLRDYFIRHNIVAIGHGTIVGCRAAGILGRCSHWPAGTRGGVLSRP